MTVKQYTEEQEQRVLGILEAMSEAEFNEFLESLPLRTTMLIKGGLVDWREVLPRWYLQRKEQE